MSQLQSFLHDPSWRTVLKTQFSESYFETIERELESRRSGGAIIYPKDENIFSAFNLTPFEAVSVVILGQDPYHGPGQAMGLSFSVPKSVKVPPSLRNILKEIEDDIGHSSLTSGDLTGWAKQGVLLLNTSLTVEDGNAGSHAKLGWHQFTDAVIQSLSHEREGIVFILWGSHAQKKSKLIDRAKHMILEGPHPSPLSAYRGFFGCKHFSKANHHLKKMGKAKINW